MYEVCFMSLRELSNNLGLVFFSFFFFQLHAFDGFLKILLQRRLFKEWELDCLRSQNLIA